MILQKKFTPSTIQGSYQRKDIVSTNQQYINICFSFQHSFKKNTEHQNLKNFYTKQVTKKHLKTENRYCTKTQCPSKILSSFGKILQKVANNLFCIKHISQNDQHQYPKSLITPHNPELGHFLSVLSARLRYMKKIVWFSALTQSICHLDSGCN